MQHTILQSDIHKGLYLKYNYIQAALDKYYCPPEESVCTVKPLPTFSYVHSLYLNDFRAAKTIYTEYIGNICMRKQC